MSYDTAIAEMCAVAAQKEYEQDLEQRRYQDRRDRALRLLGFIAMCGMGKDSLDQVILEIAAAEERGVMR